MNHQLLGIDLIVAATIGGIAILNTTILWFMPRLTRPDLYFAVTVPSGFRDAPTGKSILRRYRTQLVLISLFAFLIFAAGVAWLGIRFANPGLIIQVFAGFIAFYLARKRTLPYGVSPTAVRETELREHERVIPGGWIAALGPFILLAICAGYLWFHGAEPRTALSGSVHRQFDGSQAGSTVYLLSMSAVLVLLTLFLYGLARWVRPVYAGGPEHARELKFRRTVSVIVLAAEYHIVLQASWILFIPRHQPLLAVATLPLALVFVLIVVVVLARLGQGGSRALAAGQKSLGSAVPVGDRTPDHYWKLGVFYFNPDDSAIFVEKRFGLGYSLNFARPTAWIMVALLLMAPLIPILAHVAGFLPKLRG
jgi:uncharacterized membrane protein